ncbi:hypothetical protein BaRGS_00039916 [Batillaria attramentaria]|uniref:Uncharacterized protein n=1 Tax=Batillaria attramentaria TaxID=370345 RepID=A0ABD0J1S2_9CAEN
MPVVNSRFLIGCLCNLEIFNHRDRHRVIRKREAALKLCQHPLKKVLPVFRQCRHHLRKKKPVFKVSAPNYKRATKFTGAGVRLRQNDNILSKDSPGVQSSQDQSHTNTNTCGPGAKWKIWNNILQTV